jgi:anti-sigma factor RsiW
MDCKKFKARLHAYLDGELTPAEREAFDLHVLDCPVCRAEVEGYRGLGMLLGGLSVPKVPAGLAERILAAASKASEVSKIAGASRTSKVTDSARRSGVKPPLHFPARVAVAWRLLEGNAMRAAAAAALVVGLTAGSLLGWGSLAKPPMASGEISQAGADILLDFGAFSASPVEPLETLFLSENTIRP